MESDSILQKLRELQLNDQQGQKPCVLEEVSVDGIVKHIRKIASSKLSKLTLGLV